MSFDIFFMSFPASAKLLDDVPADFEHPPLGSRAEIVKKLLKAVPYLRQASDGELYSDHVPIEFFIGDEDPCNSFMVALRGGPEGVAAIDAICRAGFRATAPGVDEIITSGEQLAKALGAWEEYRDHVTAKLSKPNPPNNVNRRSAS